MSLSLEPARSAMAEPRPAQRTPSALWALSFTVLISSLATSIASVSLPAIALAFHATVGEAQAVVVAYLASITAAVVVAGRIGDLVGRRRVLLAGIAVFTVASAGCALSSTLWQLVVLRVIQGVGAAVMLALSTASVGEAAGVERTGRAMGRIGTLSAIGTALGPILGGGLVAGPGWWAVFGINVPLGLLAWLAVGQTLGEDGDSPRTKSGSFDAAGAALLTLALVSYVLAMVRGRGNFGGENAALLALAAGAFLAFVHQERRTGSPLLEPSAMRDPGLRRRLATSGAMATLLMTTLVVGPFYLARGLGSSPGEIGVVMTAGPAIAALTGSFAGEWVDRLGADRLARVGMVVSATGGTLFALMEPSWGVEGYIAALVVLTAGYALFQTANNAAVMAQSDAGRRGVISGLLNLSRNLGLTTGAALVGTIFAWTVGRGATPDAPTAVAAGLHAAFAAGTAIVVIAALWAHGSPPDPAARRR